MFLKKRLKLKTKIKMKKLTRFLGVMIIAAAIAVGSTAHALTQAQANAIIAALGLTGSQASVIQALVVGGGSTVVSTTFTSNLTIGSTGSEVVALQDLLISRGHLVMPAGVSKGYFGPLTQQALAKMQAANGISPAVGYFGPITRNFVNSLVVVTPPSTTPTTPTTPVLQGGEGYIEVDVILDADPILDLGDIETIIEVSVEAKDSDVSINRVDFMFENRPWLYFSEVNLLVDGKEVASLSRSSDFTDVSGDWRARFSNLNIVIEEGDSVDIALEVAVLASMQGTRADDDFDVWLPEDGIRVTDAAGLTQYGPEDDVVIYIDGFGDSFGDGLAKLTVGDNSPTKAVVVLDEDVRTNGVTVLEFVVEAKDSDIEITEVEVEFASAGSDEKDLVYRAYLYRGNTLVSQKSVNDEYATFNNLSHKISKGSKQTFTVKLDFNKTDGLTLGDFEVVEVVVDYENADYIEDTATLSVGEVHKLVNEVLVATFVSKTAPVYSTLGDNTIAKVTFTMDLTAVGGVFYIAEDGSGFDVDFDNGDINEVSRDITSTNAFLMSNGDAYRINEDQTRRVTFEIVVESDAGTESGRVILNSLEFWNNADLDDVDDTVTLGAPEYRSSTVTVFTQ